MHIITITITADCSYTHKCYERQDYQAGRQFETDGDAARGHRGLIPIPCQYTK